MVKSILQRVKNRMRGEAEFPAKHKVQASSTIGPLSSMLGPSGRITLASLKWFFQESGRNDFIEYVQNPLLIGSALNAESISNPHQPEEDVRGNTNVLKASQTHIVNMDDQLSKRSGPGTSLPYAIYPLMKRTHSASHNDRFAIGRIKENDMIMKDMAISKRHAIIDIHKGSFLLKDCGSTNGTRLNGQTVNANPVELNDKDIIQLGNHRFTFLTPASLYDLLSES
jgi:hypothetical protein